MKKRRSFWGALSIFLFLSAASGQPKAITEKAYEAAVGAARSKTEQKVRVEITIEKNFENGALLQTTHLTQEYLPPGRRERWVFIETAGKNVTTTEIIYLGDTEYRRTNGGLWMKTDTTSGDGERKEIVSVEKERSGSDSKYSVETVREDGQVYQVYTKSTVDKLDAETTYLSEYNIWIRDGLIYKVTDVLSLNESRNVESTSITTFDYSPKKFEIKAPVAGKKTKS
jgi:hypothetical protein